MTVAVMAELWAPLPGFLGLSRFPKYAGGEVGAQVITVIYLGARLEQGSSCFLLELIFCPTFISYCAFLWGQSSFVRQKAGLSPLEIFLDSLCLYKWTARQCNKVAAWPNSGCTCLVGLWRLDSKL